MIRACKSRTAPLWVLAAILAATAVQAGDTGRTGASPATKAVFDFRAASPQTAAVYLDLAHDTYRDAVATASVRGGEAAFAVVFIGPAVKLLVPPPASPATDEDIARARMQERLTAMAADGIALEVCLFAADLLGVDPDSMHSAVTRVENGWISTIDYQARGFALVPAY
ncbi:MAG: DsrE family protein [Thermoanaerobaculia bacterium]|nr:DsrE family protein [Thermoanaerobaculia bacterium]